MSSITYYAIVDYRSTPKEPAGLARRRVLDTGEIYDEALNRGLGWEFTPLISEWRRAESTDDLVEVSEEEAERIIEGFRTRWQAEA
jgi:hypothetical protein